MDLVVGAQRRDERADFCGCRGFDDHRGKALDFRLRKTLDHVLDALARA
jgi:hypothetical protein